MMAAAICPGCGEPGAVAESAQPHLGRWLCSSCWLLFDGGTAEWSRLVRARRHRQRQHREAA